ncbi:hypothetical protein P7K49_015999 [Saguinus oedipus]|uniref:Glycoprotein endo-alpha-1,2-mannosidase-like protein n=1 Tax=Saguinus oedipus TaxID=9490 RepID=A0ABQ9VBM7_SAGOE|nr:hypothetical protein P7K49_015999 [Saguinus oedipus]
MARRRRRACIALFLVLLFAFGTLMGLRTLKAPDGLPALGPGLELAPFERRPEGAPAPAARAPAVPAAPPPPPPPPRTADPGGSPGPAPAEVEPAPGQTLRVYSDLHAFYYSWYGSPRREGHYIHWDHVMVPHWDPKISASYPRGRHSPPDDLGSSFYPELGPYSSRDPEVLREHMTQLKEAAIGERPPPRVALTPASPFLLPTPQLPLVVSPGLWSHLPANLASWRFLPTHHGPTMRHRPFRLVFRPQPGPFDPCQSRPLP